MKVAFTSSELASVAEQVLTAMGESRVLCLVGELGAGKTTLVKAMVQVLGYDGPTSSPSFGLLNVYEAPIGPVYHADLYRLRDVTELETLGLEEVLESGSYVFIEWAELAKNLLPPNTLRLSLKITGEYKRELSLTQYI
jgi:tRNA threonylcarbamoyladenosine biosynthesis protein TsaE